MKFLIKNLSFLLTAIFRQIYSSLISKIFSFGSENQIRQNNETQKKYSIISGCYELGLFHDFLCLVNVVLFWIWLKSLSWWYFTIFKRWVMEALSADRFIRFFSSNKFNLLRLDSSLGKCCWFGTVNTNSC